MPFLIKDGRDHRLAVLDIRCDDSSHCVSHIANTLREGTAIGHGTRLLNALPIPFPILSPQHDAISSCDRFSALKDGSTQPARLTGPFGLF